MADEAKDTKKVVAGLGLVSAQDLVDAINRAEANGYGAGQLQAALKSAFPKVFAEHYPLGFPSEENKWGAMGHIVPAPTTPASSIGRMPWQQAAQVSIPQDQFGSVVYLGATHAEQRTGSGDSEFHMNANSGVKQFSTIDNVNNVYLQFKPDEQQRFVDFLDAYYGKGKWDQTKAAPFWKNAVMLAATAYMRGDEVTPWDAMKSFVDGAIKDGSAPSVSSGMHVGYRDVQTTLTNRTQAKALVDNALSNYLGRSATEEETQQFLAALNSQEKSSPQVTEGSRSYNAKGASTGTSATTQGGIDPAEFAKEWAMSREGSAEHAAATTYLDAFMQTLGADVRPAGV